MVRTEFIFIIIAGFVTIVPAFFSRTRDQKSITTSIADDSVAKIIFTIIGFVQKLGLAIMTGVILGSSIMAIFGKLPWPAIVMLVVFTAIFFGAGKLITKFANGVNNTTESTTVC